MLDLELIQIATNEAIYWWKRDEYYYHKVFSNFVTIYEDSEQLEFFGNYLFKSFTKQYSVSRTLKNIDKNLSNLIDYLNTKEYFTNVIAGNISIIDEVANNFPKYLSNGKPISFLSKLAFLINPLQFSLYDTLARNSLSEILKEEKSIHRAVKKSYTEFINFIDDKLDKNNVTLNKQINKLDNFNICCEIEFLKDNPLIFKRRVYDKYLWLYSQNDKNRRGQSEVRAQLEIWKYYDR
jgi:hypothetical protein